MTALFRMLGAGLAYFSIASVLSIVVLLGLGWYTGKLTPQKLARLRAVIHGISEDKGVGSEIALDVEQPSYEEILEQRRLDFRQLELREEIVRQNVSFMDRQRAAITAKRQEFDTAKQKFEEQLAAMEAESTSTGEEDMRLTVENIKPAQAKQQITLMLDRGEFEKVVSLLAAMSITKRAKIVAEFRTPEDATRLSKILELMADGAPLTPMIEESRSTASPQPVQR